MIFSEELHQKLQELKTATDPAEKSRIVRECVAIYKAIDGRNRSRQPNPQAGGVR